MRIFFPLNCLLIITYFNLSLSASLVFAQDKTPAIATLLQVEGNVEAVTAKSPRGRRGNDGILLHVGDQIRTSEESKATVEYRDGSSVRLFQNSEIVLNLSEEQFTNRRTFKYQLTLKKGSLRGRFMKGLQHTKIRTPTALIGVKGTSLRITDNNNNATVSLTEGQLEVSNLSSSTILNPGQWLPDFGRTDDLTKKVGPIPNLLYLKTDIYELDFRNEKSKQLEFSVQIQNNVSGKILERSGPVLFESDYKGIRLPKRFLLNEKGFARVLVGIDPPRLEDPEFKGLITIRAFMDGEGFDDIAEGSLVLKIRNLGKKRTILLDPDKGVVKKND